MNSETKQKKFRYSEIFGGHGYLDDSGKLVGGSMQGEGEYTGIPTVWYRAWGCNFNCSGFSQENPMDPSTWETLDYEKIDATAYSSVEDLPVFNRGCDSSYSWSKKFMHLANYQTTAEISGEIRKRLVNGRFKHPVTGVSCHMAFTGGEPMMSQTALVAIVNQFEKDGDIPEYITIESNGTQPIREEFENLFTRLLPYNEGSVKELFWSVSPKIQATSGEMFEDAIKPEVVKKYHDLSMRGQLKFVCNGRTESWNQIEAAVKLYRDAGITWPIWIMPVGATIEGQQLVAADVADQALHRGYNISARVHTYIWGNAVGR